MNLDLRIPMGLMFLLVGLILVLKGIATNGSEIYARAGDINVNLDWGLVLLAFGAVMLLLGRRNQRRLEREAALQSKKPQQSAPARRGH